MGGESLLVQATMHYRLEITNIKTEYYKVI
jgi:hypothetical protein